MNDGQKLLRGNRQGMLLVIWSGVAFLPGPPIRFNILSPSETLSPVIRKFLLIGDVKNGISKFGLDNSARTLQWTDTLRIRQLPYHIIVQNSQHQWGQIENMKLLVDEKFRRCNFEKELKDLSIEQLTLFLEKLEDPFKRLALIQSRRKDSRSGCFKCQDCELGKKNNLCIRKNCTA